MSQFDNNAFTGITTPNKPGTTILGLASSFESEFTQTTGARAGPGASNQPASSAVSEASSASDAATASGSPAVAATSTTFSTSVTSVASSNSNDLPSTTASNAASNTSGAVTVSHSSCNSISCSSALKAAVAVPIVVAAIAAVFLFFFCARKRRNRGSAAVVSEKQPKKAGKKWSRHLRAFSFDAELLMGGRFSSTNSIRSRDPSVRSGAHNAHGVVQSAEPSLHSIEEEVAPPYRDAIAHSQPPASPTQLRSTAPITTVARDPIARPASTATAPPSYGSVVGETRTIRDAGSNPFADSAPVSPIEDSPFSDPPEDEETHAGGLRPMLSRGSSMYQSLNADDASEVASIRQAQVGRRVSARATGNTGGGSG
ncbi:hypothetical protein A1O3_04414 [Capronia epimyces CBS 606.96]|uniref:Uncharacterized protein n=1 Tax=Capronia epimyces CBS 606.96 TaxID=1182542 RepID=W9YYT6_9EURO|nr:uncharacterized protein A1O3_04414 [Capronia epimyces CBS 606.96]EXJ87454.1 hypothetical protein A1O3_04414 [Capronia epimyces CBS 606.96]